MKEKLCVNFVQEYIYKLKTNDRDVVFKMNEVKDSKIFKKHWSRVTTDSQTSINHMMLVPRWRSSSIIADTEGADRWPLAVAGISEADR